MDALADRLTALLLSPGSTLSVWSFLAAGLIVAWTGVRRRRGRMPSLRALIRSVTPRGLATPSGRADIGFTLIAVFVSSALFGWAVVSHLWIADAVGGALGAPLALGLPAWAAVAATTVVLWVAYEFAYFANHWLCHKSPVLWAFHKVHHSAESLSPLTIFRVHPVDTIFFYNCIALATGIAAGAMRWMVGADAPAWTIGGANVLAVAALLSVKHLHHSHAWIAWSGRWSRLILSPAHHQIHHSRAVEHHDRNFGDMLGLFDWLAGTLYQPSQRRPELRFGVDGVRDPHGVRGALLAPFGDAATEFGAIVTAGQARGDAADFR